MDFGFGCQTGSDCPAPVLLKNGADRWEEIGAGKLQVGAFVGPVAKEAEFVLILKPVTEATERMAFIFDFRLD